MPCPGPLEQSCGCGEGCCPGQLGSFSSGRHFLPYKEGVRYECPPVYTAWSAGLPPWAWADRPGRQELELT